MQFKIKSYQIKYNNGNPNSMVRKKVIEAPTKKDAVETLKRLYKYEIQILDVTILKTAKR